MTAAYGDLLGLSGDLHFLRVESPALAGNALGDSAARTLAVYTPPGYEPEGSRRYPVLYVLHGYTGDVAALIATRPWEHNVVQRADRLIREHAMPPTIVVCVDGNTRLGGSQYVDSIHNGDYATYVVRDVVGAVDAAFRTLPHEGARGVLGKSSGGFGSLHLVMNRPGVFGAFASHSGDSYFRMAQVGSFVNCWRTLRNYERFEDFVRAFEAKENPSQAEFGAMEILGYGAAYSPRAAEAFAIDLPFVMETGEFDEAVLARWLAFDPAEQCLQKKDELARLRLRYIDCGTRDEYALDVGARVMTKRMRDLGLDVQHEEFDGGHGKIGYRYDVSMPAVLAVLDRE